MSDETLGITGRTAYAVLFDHRQLVEGDGFVAEVAVAGRALLREGLDGAVFSGVQPAGFAGSGTTRANAWAEFLEGLRLALVEIAEEASGYDAFRVAAESFFNGPNGALERLWTEAVMAVKSGATKVGWARTVESYPDRGIRIRQLELDQPDPALGAVVQVAA